MFNLMRLYECSLRSSERSLQLMQTSCRNEQQQRDLRGATTQLRQMSEPKLKKKERNVLKYCYVVQGYSAHYLNG
ncbi:unnamed protein product [Wuchereria bancrofti]|uniref:Uncharacterized protein n=1 Tax=Wuchereria bancrofti TaxID=6293 RepID=A0A3P7FBE1_WUCBA|nr:unnamed protein product [Wuchereria bancrofti]